MKLYCYAMPDNTVLTKGYLSLDKNPDYNHFFIYKTNVESQKREDVINWLETTFPGRSRSISCLSDPIRWKNNDTYLRYYAPTKELFSFELNDLIKDGLVESIWCKESYDIENKIEHFHQIKDLNEIVCPPLPWEKCNTKKYGSLFNVIPHYMIVLKDGLIPPQYITSEAKPINVRTIEFASAEYEQELNLRNQVLRHPLGLSLTPAELMGEEHHQHIGIFKDNKLIGCLVFTPKDNAVLQMRQVAVDPEYQGQDIGYLLVSFAEDMAREQKAPKIYLHARKSAVGFYEKLGYLICSEEYTSMGIAHFDMQKDIS